MHQFRKQSAGAAQKATKVRLAKRANAPELKDLQAIRQQAMISVGQEVEVQWSDSNGIWNYLLSAKAADDGGEPCWALWQDNGSKSELVWRYEHYDVSLISDFLQMVEFSRASTAGTGNAGQAQPNSAQQAGLSPQAPPVVQNESPPAGHAASAPAQSHAQAGTPLGQTAKPSPDQAYPNSPVAQAFLSLTRAARAVGPELAGIHALSPTALEGDISKVQVATLLQSMSMGQVTGKLEILGEEGTGNIYFYGGNTPHAATTTNTGDAAIAELVTLNKGIFRFYVDEQTELRSVENRIDKNIMDGMALLDQRKHLEAAGLTYESYLVKKHKNLSDSEFRVMLIKAAEVDFAAQLEVYRKIGPRCTLSDLLRDRPMSTPLWTAILFNFFSCGLIELKPPDAVQRGVLDFIGDTKSAVQTVANQFIRPETGIMTYAAFLYFLEYEYFRFDSYGWPLTVILFELSKSSESLKGGLDLISQVEAKAAAKRIELIKRPLDRLAHFEALQYGLLLPNTTVASGAYVANRILQALIAAPLSNQLDKKNLRLAFGVASLPKDGEDLENLLLGAKQALHQAKNGNFPIVLTSSLNK